MLFEANCSKDNHSLSNVLQKYLARKHKFFALFGCAIMGNVLPGRIVLFILAVTKVLPFQIASLKLEIGGIIIAEKMKSGL
jgi:hypothetical protein